MTVNHIRVRTMEHVTTWSMTTDVSVWQVSMEHIVIIVRIFFHVLFESKIAVKKIIFITSTVLDFSIIHGGFFCMCIFLIF